MSPLKNSYSSCEFACAFFIYPYNESKHPPLLMTETLPRQCRMQFKPAFSSPSPHILGPPIEGGIFWDEYLSRASAFDGPCGKRLESKNKTKWGEKWKKKAGVAIFWPDWHSSSRHVIHSEREAQVPLLLLPAQVYDNPNKLWCAAQTLKTLIGTKSNRPCLSGQRVLGEWLCVCSSRLPPSNYQFLSVLKSHTTPGAHFSLLSQFVYSYRSAQLVIFRCFFGALFSERALLRGWLDKCRRHSFPPPEKKDRLEHCFCIFPVFVAIRSVCIFTLFAGDLTHAWEDNQIDTHHFNLAWAPTRALCRLFCHHHHHQLQQSLVQNNNLLTPNLVSLMLITGPHWPLNMGK